MKAFILVTRCASKTIAAVFTSKGQVDLVRFHAVIGKPNTMQSSLSIKHTDFSYSFTSRFPTHTFPTVYHKIIISFFVDFIQNPRYICGAVIDLIALRGFHLKFALYLRSWGLN